MEKPKIIFAGTGSFAVPVLEKLHSCADIQIVLTSQKYKSDNRNLSPVAKLAQSLGLRLFNPATISDVLSELVTLKADAFIVVDYGEILPESALRIAKTGATNIHPSLLPRHRGPAPIAATILAGDKRTGVTIIAMDEQMDHGPIVAQKSVALSGNERADYLENELSVLAAELLTQTLLPYIRGECTPVAQDDSKATYHKLLKREDGRLTFESTADEVWRTYRAYYPWPGIWLETHVRNRPQRIKLLDIEPGPNLHAQKETWYWDGKRLLLFWRSGTTYINQLQLSGAKKISAEEFLRGFHDLVVTTLPQ